LVGIAAHSDITVGVDAQRAMAEAGEIVSVGGHGAIMVG
jgi:hypothetical protein